MSKVGKKRKLPSKPDVEFYVQVRSVIADARRYVHAAANAAMVKAYGLVGKMIAEKQGGEERASYGDGLIDGLAKQLTSEFGSGFGRVNLFAMRKFYLAFPKVQTLCEQLSWSHYRLLITVEDAEARQYYLEECRKSVWSVRELQRIFATKYKLVLPSEKELLAEIRREQMVLEEVVVSKMETAAMKDAE